MVCELRYRGQAFELAVEGTDDLRERFEAAHERAYGYRDADDEVELVTVRVTTAAPGPEISAEHSGDEAAKTSRTTTMGATTIWRGRTGERSRGRRSSSSRRRPSSYRRAGGARATTNGTVRLWTR